MDTYSNKSSSLELSLKNRSELFAPFKLKNLESRPTITLKKMGEELDIAETKCLTLKSELNYMMGVCQKAQTEIKGSKGAFDVSQEPISLYKSPRLKLPVEYNDANNEIKVTDKISNCNVFQKLHNTEKKVEETFDTTYLSPRVAHLSPRKNIDDHDIIEKTDSSLCQTIDGKQKELLGTTITPKDHLYKKSSFAGRRKMKMPIENNMEAGREYENSLPCFSKHLQSVLRLGGSVEELTSKKDKDDYFWVRKSEHKSGFVGLRQISPIYYTNHCAPTYVSDLCLRLVSNKNNFCIQALRPSSVQTNIRDPELNVTSVAKVRRGKKSNRAPKTERNETSSICKTVDTMSRVRKKKGKLRSFASKSTLTTKDISITGRKHVRRCKRKAQNPATSHKVHPQSVPIKHAKKSKEVLELFHNTMLKSSNSEISSKYSKLSQVMPVKQQHIVKTTVNQKIQEQLPSEQIDHKNQCYNKENQQIQILSNQRNLRTTPENIQQQSKSTNPSINSPSPIQCKTHQYEDAIFNRYIDSIRTPSYEMSTLASRLKRSSKLYFSRFNFRNIPFVVGTSVTPSHNLGLNIQQVLSIMKMRQPLANDIAPLLVQKGGSMNPLSNFLHINKQCEKSSSRQIIGAFNSKVSLSLSKDKGFSIFDLRNVGRTQNVLTPNFSDNAKLFEKDNNIAKQLFKEKGNEQKIKRQFFSVINKTTLPANAEDQREISGIVTNKQKIGIYNTHISASRNSKEIRDVLINLHNQFEEMNTKYEKLQSQMEKTNDKSLAKELTTLEKELTIKEEEINAVIGLYKEVMALKQQMKTLHEKNSLVCVELAKETPRKNPFSVSILSGKSPSIGSAEIFGRRKVFSGTREPPAAMQLAALLRQIQTFHKQLQLIS